jgi:hypothetical protein
MERDDFGHHGDDARAALVSHIMGQASALYGWLVQGHDDAGPEAVQLARLSTGELRTLAAALGVVAHAAAAAGLASESTPPDEER